MPDGTLSLKQLTILQPAKDAMFRHVREWEECTKCEIGKIAHEHVFCRGTLPCDLLFVGEGPGKTEDVMGRPFVGQAGRLLDLWMHEANMHVAASRYIHIPVKFAVTNLVLCRPCDRLGGPNRAPTPCEQGNCRPRLSHFLQEIARPRGLVTLGKVAAANLPSYELPRLELIHPAAVIRNGGRLEIADGKLYTAESKAAVRSLARFTLEVLRG